MGRAIRSVRTRIRIRITRSDTPAPRRPCGLRMTHVAAGRNATEPASRPRLAPAAACAARRALVCPRRAAPPSWRTHPRPHPHPRPRPLPPSRATRPRHRQIGPLAPRRRRPSPGQPDAPAHSLPAVSHRSVAMHRALVHSHPTRLSAGRPRPRHPPACNFQHRPAPLLKSHAARRLLVRRQHRSPPRHHHHHHHPGRRGAALASLVRTHARRPGLALSAHGSRASAALPSPQQPRA